MEYEEHKLTMLAAFSAFFGTFAVGDTASGIVEDIQEGFGGIVGQMIDSIRDMIEVISGTFISEIANVIEALFSVIIMPIEMTVELIEDFFGIFDGLFDQLTGDIAIVGIETGGVFMSTGGQLGVPAITWGLLGVIMGGIGVSLITTTANIPIPVIGRIIPLEGIGGGIGSIFVISGSMIGVWGFFPNLSQYILGLTFAFIFATAGYTYMQVVRSTVTVSSDSGT